MKLPSQSGGGEPDITYENLGAPATYTIQANTFKTCVIRKFEFSGSAGELTATNATVTRLDSGYDAKQREYKVVVTNTANDCVITNGGNNYMEIFKIVQ